MKKAARRRPFDVVLSHYHDIDIRAPASLAGIHAQDMRRRGMSEIMLPTRQCGKQFSKLASAAFDHP